MALIKCAMQEDPNLKPLYTRACKLMAIEICHQRKRIGRNKGAFTLGVRDSSVESP